LDDFLAKCLFGQAALAKVGRLQEAKAADCTRFGIAPDFDPADIFPV